MASTMKKTSTIIVVLVLSLLISNVAWALFSASITNRGSVSSGTLILASNNGSGTCRSSNAIVSSNAVLCQGAVGPAGQLSSTSSASGSVILSDLGNTNPQSGSVSNGQCGVQYIQDTSGNNNHGVPYYDVSFGAPAPPTGGSGILFGGTHGYAQTLNQITDPYNFTIVGWFKTSSANGGTIVGFTQGQDNAAATVSADRTVWIDNAGYVSFSVNISFRRFNFPIEVTSANTYNDGKWHFFDASVGASGIILSVDNNTPQTSSLYGFGPSSYAGYWHLGWGDETSVADAPNDPYFNGSLGQIAILGSQLSPTSSTITGLYAASSSAAYGALVLAQAPSAYWPMTDTGGVAYTGTLPGVAASPTFADISGNGNTGTGQGGYTKGVSGPLGGNAVALNGTSGWVETPNPYTSLANFSLVAYFDTTVATGTIISMTNQLGVGSPADHDRQIWMDPSGHLVFGAYSSITGRTYTVTSPGSYADGHWHLVVGTLSATGGMALYVDGALVGTNTAPNIIQYYTGYWHIGWGDEQYWADPPTGQYFEGSLAHVGVTPAALSAAQVSALYGAATTDQFMSTMMSYTPMSYWPMSDSYNSTACQDVWLTVQDTSGASVSCLDPSVANGACPAPSSSYTLLDFRYSPMTAPTAATPSTIKVSMQEDPSISSALRGIHLLTQFGFYVSNGFYADNQYGTSYVEL